MSATTTDRRDGLVGRSPARRIPVLLVIAVLLSAAINPSAEPTSRPDPEEALRDGLKALEDGELDTAWVILHRLAIQGMPAAQVAVGRLYAHGVHAPPDAFLAAHWYREAAEAGDSEGMFLLALCHIRGTGVDWNLTEARGWLERSAQANHAAAMNALGEMEFRGDGGPSDRTSARLWFERAADLGNASAMVNLAAIHRDGLGVPKDRMRAFEWYRKAAELLVARQSGWRSATIRMTFGHRDEFIIRCWFGGGKRYVWP